jgi:HEAT repeat protein
VTESRAAERLRAALDRIDPSDRLQAALTAGTYPDDAYVEALVQRCAYEHDFSVREMLTWALVRHSAAVTVPRVLRELDPSRPVQARSQALHTLSKIGDRSAWPAITSELLRNPDDAVARTAWRAAVALVPAGEEPALADELATQLARGDREVQLSLSRALIALGENARPALADRADDDDYGVRIHALATVRLLDDPDEGFDTALFEARLADVPPETEPDRPPDADPTGFPEG